MKTTAPTVSMRRNSKKGGFAFLLVVSTIMFVAMLILGVVIVTNNTFFKTKNTIDTEEASYLARAISQDIAEKISKKTPDIDNQFGSSNNFLSYKAQQLKMIDRNVVTDYSLLFDKDNTGNQEINNFRALARDLVGITVLEDAKDTLARWMVVPVVPTDPTLDITRFNIVTEILSLTTKEARELDLNFSTLSNEWDRICYFFNVNTGKVIGKSEISISRVFGVDDLEASMDIEDFLSNYPINIIYGDATEYDEATKTYLNQYTSPKFENSAINSKKAYFFADIGSTLKMIVYPLTETIGGAETLLTMGTVTINGKVVVVGNVKANPDGTPTTSAQYYCEGFDGVGNLFLQNTNVVSVVPTGATSGIAINIAGSVDITNSINEIYVSQDDPMKNVKIFAQQKPNYINGKISAQGPTSNVRIIGSEGLRTRVEGDIICDKDIYLENVDVVGNVISKGGKITLVNTTVSQYVRSDATSSGSGIDRVTTGEGFVGATILLTNGTRVGGGVISFNSSIGIMGDVWVGMANSDGTATTLGSVFSGTDLYITDRGYNTAFNNGYGVITGEKATSTDSALLGSFHCGGNINIGKAIGTDNIVGDLILESAKVANPVQYLYNGSAYETVSVFSKVIKATGKIRVVGTIPVIFGQEISNATDFEYIRSSDGSSYTFADGNFVSDKAFFNITLKNVNGGNALEVNQSSGGNHKLFANINVTNGEVYMQGDLSVYKILTSSFRASGDAGISNSTIERLQISVGGEPEFRLNSSMTIGTLIVGSNVSSASSEIDYKNINLTNLTVDRVYGMNINLTNIKTNSAINLNRLNGLKANTGIGTSGNTSPPTANTARNGLIAAGRNNEGEITLNASCSIKADMAAKNIYVNSSQIGAESRAYLEPSSSYEGGKFVMDNTSNKKYTGVAKFAAFGPEIMLPYRDRATFNGAALTVDNEDTLRNAFGFGSINAEDGGEVNFGEYWNVLQGGSSPLDDKGNFRTFGNWAIFDSVPGNISVSGNLKIYENACYSASPIDGKPIGIYAGGYVQLYASAGTSTVRTSPTSSVTYGYSGVGSNFKGTIYAGKGLQILDPDGSTKLTIEGNVILGDAGGSLFVDSAVGSNKSVLNNVYIKGDFEHRGSDPLEIKNSVIEQTLYTKAAATIENTTVKGAITHTLSSELTAGTEKDKISRGTLTIRSTDPNGASLYYVGGDISTAYALVIQNYEIRGSVRANGWNNNASGAPNPQSISISISGSKSTGDKELHAPNGGISLGGKSIGEKYLVNNIYAKYDITLNAFSQVSSSVDKGAGVTTGVTSQSGNIIIGALSSNDDIILDQTKLVAPNGALDGSVGSFTVNSLASVDLNSMTGRGVNILSNFYGTSANKEARPNNSIRLRHGDLTITGSMQGDIFLDRGKLTIASNTANGIWVEGNITAQGLYTKNAIIGKQNTVGSYNTNDELNAIRTKLHISGVVTQIISTIFHSECNFVGGMASGTTAGADDFYEIMGSTIFYGRLTIGRGYVFNNAGAGDYSAKESINSTDIRTKGHIRFMNATTIVGNVFCNAYSMDGGTTWVSSGIKDGIDFDSDDETKGYNRFMVTIDGSFYYHGSIWVHSKLYVTKDLIAQGASVDCTIRHAGEIFVGGNSTIRKTASLNATQKEAAKYIVKGKTLAHGESETRLTLYDDVFVFNDVEFAWATLDGALVLGLLTTLNGTKLFLGSSVMLRGDFVIDRDLNINGYGRDVGSLTARNIFIVSNETNRRQIGVWQVTAMQNLYVVRDTPTKNADGTYNFTIGCDVFWNYRLNGANPDRVGGFVVRGSANYMPDTALTEGKANIRVYGNAILGKNFKAQNKTTLWVGGGADGNTNGYLLYDIGFRMWYVYVKGHVGGKFDSESSDHTIDINIMYWNGDDRSHKNSGIVKSIVVTGAAILMGVAGKTRQHMKTMSFGMMGDSNQCHITIGGDRTGLSGTGEGMRYDNNYPNAITTSVTRNTNGEKNFENIIASFTGSKILSTVSRHCQNNCDGDAPSGNTANHSCGNTSTAGDYVASIEHAFLMINVNVQGNFYMNDVMFATDNMAWGLYSLYVGDKIENRNNNFYMKNSAIASTGSYDSWGYWTEGGSLRDNNKSKFYWKDSSNNYNRFGLIVEGHIKYSQSVINTHVSRWGYEYRTNGSVYVSDLDRLKYYRRTNWGHWQTDSGGTKWWIGIDYNGLQGESWEGSDYNEYANWNGFWNNGSGHCTNFKNVIASNHQHNGVFYDDIPPTHGSATAVYGIAQTFAPKIEGWYEVKDFDAGSSGTTTELASGPNSSTIYWQNNRTATVNGYSVGGKLFNITGNQYKGFVPKTYATRQMSAPDIKTGFNGLTLTARPTFSLGDLLANGVAGDGEANSSEQGDATLPEAVDTLKPYNFKDPIKVNPRLGEDASVDATNIALNKSLIINSSGVLNLDSLGKPYVDAANMKYTFGSSTDSFDILFNTMGKDMHVILKKGWSIELDGPNSAITILGTGRVFVYAYPGSNFTVLNGSSVGRVDDGCTLANGAFESCHSLDGANHGQYSCANCTAYCSRCSAVARWVFDEYPSWLLKSRLALCGSSRDGCGYVDMLLLRRRNVQCSSCKTFCQTQCPTCKGNDICYKTHPGRPCPNSPGNTLTKLYFVSLQLVDSRGNPTSENIGGKTIDNDTPITLSFGNGIAVNAFFYLNATRNSKAEYFASNTVSGNKNIFSGSVLATNIIFYPNASGQTYTFSSRMAELTYIDYGNGLHHAIDPPDDFDSDNNDKWGIDKIK